MPRRRGRMNHTFQDASESSAASINNSETTNLESQVDHRLQSIEDLLQSHLNRHNGQMKQLEDKIKVLEEQVDKQKNRIKDLEDQVMLLQPNKDAKENKIEPLIVTSDKEDTSNKNVNSIGSVVPNNSTNNNVNVQNGKTVQGAQSGTTCRRGNYVFTRWMNSRDGSMSLWANDKYRSQLLSYIGRIYEQKKDIHRVIGPLRVECNASPEMDQLFKIIKQFEKQPGALEAIRKWRLHSRPDHRLAEIKAIFEYSRAHPHFYPGLRMSSPTILEEIINRASINGYFDMICRDALITAEIGSYLNLNKENTFGGTDYDSHNTNVTLVNVDLNRSIISLDDNRVDLITCFVTLHHVPHLEPMLAEFVRILRPGGYLLVREHDCKNEHTLRAKYLNFVHAFMIIARVGEFACNANNHLDNTEGQHSDDLFSDSIDWEQEKLKIIEYTSSIQYRTRLQWQQCLESVGFQLKAIIDYTQSPDKNPQALYYAVFQLKNK